MNGYVPDERPILGPGGKANGPYYTFGFCGADFHLGPRVGEVLAELIDTGATSAPIEFFSIRRFATANTAETCAARSVA